MKKGLVILWLLALFGCQDFLTRQPGEQTSFEEQLATEQGVLQAVNGLYNALFGLMSASKYLYGDLMGGNLTFSPNVTGSLTGIVNIPANYELIYSFNDSDEESNFSSVYQDFYEIIVAVNILLEGMEETEIEVSLRQKIRSEALAIRAFCHFELLNLYAQNYTFTADANHMGIVLVDNLPVAGEDFPTRKTVRAGFDFIESDLTEALQNNTEGPSLSYFSETSYFSKNAIKALLARVYLYKNDWENAALLANELINTSGITLLDSSNYIQSWLEPNTPVAETILELPVTFNDSEGVGFSISTYFERILVNGTILEAGDYVASGDLLDLFGSNDIRKTQLLDSIMMVTKDEFGEESMLPYFFTLKFQDNPGTPVFRLSEMVLIRAEANAQLGNIEAAKNDLFLLQKRVDPTAERLESDDMPTLLQAIYDEKRKEFAFEGHLFFDVKRLKKNIVRNKGCIATTCDLNYPSPFFILPIPRATLDVNPNMIQNEGY